MNDPRRSSHDTFDADLDLCVRNHVARSARVLVKYTYDLCGREARLAMPDVLQHDPRAANGASRLVPGTDFWPQKQATDFVVRGSAHAPEGRPVCAMQVRARLGEVEKRVAVFGRRTILWMRDGRPSIAAPEPFAAMPITWANAYGGVDLRVAPEGPLTLAQLLAISTGGAHPGAYPRNPLGKGYLVSAAPGAHDIEMPNLEDPNDLLTPERLITGDPRAWWRQPLPWCFDWVPATFFPRMKFFAAQADPWFPAPEDGTLPEVRRAMLPAGLRTAMQGEARARRAQTIHPMFHQEASLGLVIQAVPRGAPVVIEGMHLEGGAISFALPERMPMVRFVVEGCRVAATPRLHTVEVLPGDRRLHMVWGAEVELPRYFMPRVHREIPVSVQIDHHAPISYVASTTLGSAGANAPTA